MERSMGVQLTHCCTGFGVLQKEKPFSLANENFVFFFSLPRRACLFTEILINNLLCLGRLEHNANDSLQFLEFRLLCNYVGVPNTSSRGGN